MLPPRELTAAEADLAAVAAIAEQEAHEAAAPHPDCCGNCTAYRWHRGSGADKGHGRCHALPPDVLSKDQFWSAAAWPPVDPDQGWCRMHERKTLI